MTIKLTPISPELIPLPEGENDTTLEAFRERLRIALAQGDTKICACCGGTAKVYSRPLTAAMVRILKAIAAEPGGLTPAEITAKANKNGSGDYAKLRHWNLIEKPNKRWRATAAARTFLAGDSRLPARVILYQDIRLGLDHSETVHIDDLGGRIAGFDRETVMNPEAVQTARVPQ